MPEKKSQKKTTAKKPSGKRAAPKVVPQYRGLTSTVPAGVETDPNEGFELVARSEKDTSVYVLDKARCVRMSEVTAQSGDLGRLPFVARQFFARPGTRTQTAGTVTTKYCDQRGVYLTTKKSSVRVRNLTGGPITFFATAAQSLDNEVDVISGRTMVADNVVIEKGQSKTFTIDYGGANPYRFIDTEGRVFEHLFDGMIKVPDIPPQDQSDISNESVVVGSATINKQRRVWNEEAEVAEFSVRTEYMVQNAPQDHVLEKVASHYTKFSADWQAPYGSTVATYMTQSGKMTTSRAVQTQREIMYDVASDGYLGMGIAFLADPVAHTTVAYLAKFKFPTSRAKALAGMPPKELWEELTPEERSEIEASELAEFPAFRHSPLEDPKYSILCNGGVSFSYDANGYDLVTSSNTLRWSNIHQAFVLWDFCRDAPLYIEEGWARPNYYSQWTACFPGKGSLIFSDPTGVTNYVVNEKIDERFLLEKAITWDMVIFAITVLVEVIKGISKIANEMKRTAPQDNRRY